MRSQREIERSIQLMEECYKDPNVGYEHAINSSMCADILRWVLEIPGDVGVGGDKFQQLLEGLKQLSPANN